MSNSGVLWGTTFIGKNNAGIIDSIAKPIDHRKTVLNAFPIICASAFAGMLFCKIIASTAVPMELPIC